MRLYQDCTYNCTTTAHSTVLILYKILCTKLYQDCTKTAPRWYTKLYQDCTQNATKIVPKQYPKCTKTVTRLYKDCSKTVARLCLSSNCCILWWGRLSLGPRLMAPAGSSLTPLCSDKVTAHLTTHLTIQAAIGCNQGLVPEPNYRPLDKEERWECYCKNTEQNCFSYFLSI